MPATPGTPAITEPVYYRVRELAALLRCSPWTITNRCRRGFYPGAYQAVRYWLIPHADVAAVIEPSRTESGA